MLMRADGITRTAWALRDPETGNVHLAELCEEQEDIVRLAAAHREHRPHAPRKYPVAVVITVQEVGQ